MSQNIVKKPVVLCILDGWGYREEVENNAIKMADTPTYDRFWDTYPHAFVKTSGLAVGLPDGQMGNSEVGHMNIGGGRVVMQDLPRIDDALKTDTLKDMSGLQNFITALKKSGGACHLMGLLSPGGVHSHQDHFVALAKIISEAGIPVHIHGFLDGRDTPPKSAKEYINKFESDIANFNNVAIKTLSGRFYAMDRDQRWDRVEKAYNTIVKGEGNTSKTAEKALFARYVKLETDEFLSPTVIGEYDGMEDGDGIFMANFRSDRAREILSSLSDPNFDGFSRSPINFAAQTGLVEYSNAHNEFMTALFQPVEVKNNFGAVVSSAGLKQLRIAETEKYAHVTFFFNGGEEKIFIGEDRILVPSPNVKTYDLKPEMSAPEVTDKLVAAIKSGTYDTIIVNFANPDMVGHTGILSAAIKAVETIDNSLQQLEEALIEVDGIMLVTADHGNVELMLDQDTGVPHTAHTNWDVPIIMVNGPKGLILNNGRLADIAPTLLNLMDIPQPIEMTGESLTRPLSMEEKRAG
jgi:2,3-bisphosphoglycerate-independent phosphoglycerate mutase